MAHESTLALMSRRQPTLGQAKPLPDLQTAWPPRPPQENIQSNVLLRSFAQGHVQSGLEYLQEWSLHNLPGQPGLVFDHPDGKRSFISYLDEIPCISVCTCCLISCHSAQWRKSVPILSVPEGFVPTFFVSPQSWGLDVPSTGWLSLGTQEVRKG